MESKGLSVNIGKTKIMKSGTNEASFVHLFLHIFVVCAIKE